jgi:orotate phosphoribosyltransferase
MEVLYLSSIIFNWYVIIPSITIAIFLFFISFYLLKRERYNVLIKCGETNSFYHGVNTGEQCGKYYDIDKALSDKNSSEELTNWYIENIKELALARKIDALAFIEREDGPIGALPLMKLISSETGIPSFVVRPKRRIHASAIKGFKKIKGKNIAIISDVATSGFSIEKVADILASISSNVVAAITIVNRGGKEVADHLEKRNIAFRYVSKLC